MRSLRVRCRDRVTRAPWMASTPAWCRICVISALCVSLVACPADPANTDTDGDGVSDATDCFPEDPTRSFAAVDEYGDGVDQNCDGVDGNDRDGDGWPGDAPEDDPSHDCDDADPLVSPDDGDGDGFSGCAGDCADDDPARHPGLWEDEFDGADTDCDGADSGSLDAVTHAAFVGDAGDRAGESLAAGIDLDGDDVPDLAVGAPYADGDGSERGRVYVVFGTTLAAGGTLTADAADVVLEGVADDDRFGSWLAPAGDVDGDGLVDLVVGAARSDLNGFGSGAVHLFYGASLAAAAGPISAADADATFVGEGSTDALGLAASAGDVDGDGRDDLLLAAPLQDSGGLDAGRAYLFLASTIAAGSLDETPDGEPLGPCSRRGGFSACDADLIVTGENPDDELGTSIGAAGDLDGDGLDDVLLGVPGSDFNTVDGGLVAVVFGDDLATLLAGPQEVPATAASLFLVGSAFDARAGRSVGSADVDGDGVPDVFAGGCAAQSAGDDGASFLHVWSGASVAEGPEAVALLARFERDPKSGAGFCAAEPAGDVDGDGRGDVIVGEPEASRTARTGAGVTAVFAGGALVAGALPTVLDASWSFHGDARDGRSGGVVRGAGDVNGDGLDDLVTSAVGDEEGGENAGKVHLLLAPAR